MARAEIIPSEFAITKQFEDLPLFWQFDPATGAKAPITWRGGRIDGEFEVTYNIFSKDWNITNVMVAVDNGEVGAAVRSCLMSLDADVDERLYLLVLDILMLKYARWIEEQIAEEVSQMRVAA